MTLRAAELEAVCAELDRALAGLSVHKVVQPDDETVLLQVRHLWVLISAAPRAGRIHLVPERPAGTGEAAPAFCMLLRKHLTGARVARVHAVEGERACSVELQGADDAPQLRLFLFGPSAQLQLVARADDGAVRVLGAIGPARRTYEALPPPHPGAAASQVDRFSPAGGSISVAIAAAYATLERGASVDDARRRLGQEREAQRKKLERLALALAKDLARADDAEGRKRDADLILAHLHEIPRGAKEVVLPDDFTDGSPRTIPLDPARPARDNATRLYKEHKRLERARATITRRLEETRARIATLRAEEAQLAARADDVVLTEARELPAVPSRNERARREEAARALPYRRFESKTGMPILVGRGANKNDALTWKVARGNDLWLHTRDVPGAHVVVPRENGRDVDPDTLVDAATLAVHHSNARDEAQVDVGYALRKHLRKPRGGAPGMVLVSNQKTIRVRMEPERLARLLKSRVG